LIWGRRVRRYPVKSLCWQKTPGIRHWVWDPDPCNGRMLSTRKGYSVNKTKTCLAFRLVTRRPMHKPMLK
jgi:hypothetical protein